MPPRPDDLTPSWYDPVAVERFLAGRPVGRLLHHAERIEVVRRIVDAGGTPNEALVLLGCNTKTGRALLVSARVDRLRGLGNAVVPQVSEYIGRLILSAEGRAA